MIVDIILWKLVFKASESPADERLQVRKLRRHSFPKLSTLLMVSDDDLMVRLLGLLILLSLCLFLCH